MANYVNLMDIVYPVGSIYQSFSSTSPASSIGGTWEQITNRFLYPSTSSNTSSGTTTHCHKYGIQYAVYYATLLAQNKLEGAMVNTLNYNSDNSFNIKTGISQNTIPGTVPAALTNAVKSISAAQSYYSISDSSFASNMPPYITIYCWKRTA